MNPFFEYLLKSTISLALFYIVFKLAVSRDKMHTVNRFVLLGILATSAILPLAEIPVLQENRVIPQVEVFRQFVEAPVLNNSLPAESEVNQTVQPTNALSVNPVLLIYLFAIILLLTRIVVSLVRVAQLIQKAEKQSFQNYMLAVVKEFIHPFSFLRNIVISEKDYTENKEMVITHEYAHIKHFHAIDLIICELFTSIHWFNPFMWLLRRDLKLIHEYQADQAVLNNGIDAAKYQLLVIEKAVGERRFAMANHFTQKPILKRIKMMKKKNKKQWTWVKIIVFVPALILLLQAFSRPELITTADNFIPIAVQEDLNGKWLEKWTFENIGDGFFQPELKDIDAPRKPNNVLVILMNIKNELLIENQYAKKEDIGRIVKDFLKGKNSDGKIVVDFEEKEIPFIGKVKVSKGVISFQNDLKTSKDEINRVLKSIGEACLEERQQKANQFFNESYLSLSKEKRESVDLAVPIWFSIERPKSVKKTIQPINIKVSKNDEIFIGEYIYPRTGDQKKLLAWSKKVTLEELQEYLIKQKDLVEKENIKNGTKYDLVVNVNVEVGVTDKQNSTLKEALRKTEIQYVNYSSEFKEEDWKSKK